MPVKTSYTPEDYLRLEESADFRSEYYDGEIIPMAGGSPNHNRIAGNLYAALLIALHNKPLDTFINDLKVELPQHHSFTYPDVMVVEKPLAFTENRKDCIKNPLLIAEVLSDSTESYDRGKKFKRYRSLPSLREYVLISQKRRQVERFVKDDKEQWLLSDFEGDDTLRLASVAFELSLADLYARVNFAED